MALEAHKIEWLFQIGEIRSSARRTEPKSSRFPPQFGQPPIPANHSYHNEEGERGHMLFLSHAKPQLHMRREVLSTLLHIYELTDTHNCQVPL